jgi:hypothetical protein
LFAERKHRTPGENGVNNRLNESSETVESTALEMSMIVSNIGYGLSRWMKLELFGLGMTAASKPGWETSHIPEMS